MADYQEYRRRVLRKRWRRRFMATVLLLLLLLVGAIGMLWKSLHREQRPSGVVLVSDPTLANCRTGDATTLFSAASGGSNGRGNLLCKFGVNNQLHQ